MARRGWVARLARDWAIVGTASAAVGLASYLALRALGPRPFALSITAGSEQGARHRVADALRREATPAGIALRVVGSAGSEAALDDVDRRRLDLALVQGGLDLGRRPDLREVAALHVEPLHLLVKGDLHGAVSASLDALKGRSINLGEPGGGTARLAAEVLTFARLRADTDYTSTFLSYADLLGITETACLPDAVFMVSTLPSAVARHLVTAHGYRLVALPFAPAFGLDDLEAPPAGPHVVRRHVFGASIPAYTYEVQPAVPSAAIETLGTRLILVAHRKADKEKVRRLVEVIYESPFARVSRPKLDPDLLEQPPELPWHAGAEEYRRQTKPLFAGDAVDLVEKGLSIFGAVLTALFFLGQWLRRRYLRRRDRGFESYLLKVADVERRAHSLERSPSLDLAALLALQGELGRLKAEALEMFADGELEGESLISGFLAHVSDARDHLTRLILHERDNLEERAATEGRTADSLWREALGGG